ncbi:maleylpyruvate isomerase N-terminal domain-containing protein [Saccharopolyspora taberi]|uniref:Maleylpyruvate isomerase family mycothiol-dependent enzyme n=1 Tax=Saccharopolyspora taberi TaxID=60895 RepID=A0ABN3VM38_9PSEU
MSAFLRDAFAEQAAALRAAAVHAGPGVPVPTCEGWDVGKLVRHVARVYSMVDLSLDLEPDAERPAPAPVSEDFDEALAAFDRNLAVVAEKLSTMDPDRRVWSFFPGGTPVSWTRRMAHETAIHRLDAEHATGEHVRELLFDPRLAADGIDEMLALLLPLSDWSGSQHEGRVLYHAADAGRAWLVTYRPGKPPEVSAPHDAALGEYEVDATVAGTADAVYRKAWGRPSNAVVTGDPALAGIAAGR